MTKFHCNGEPIAHPEDIIPFLAAQERHWRKGRSAYVLLANWRRADLSEREQALAAFASNLTLHPDKANEGDLTLLREAGLAEIELLEIVQIVAIFNATNRLYAGLGIKVGSGAFDAFRSS